jgi:putative drug exporter of the RND superfamily
MDRLNRHRLTNWVTLGLWVVLAATFGVLTVLPLTGTLQMGLVVALGVLVDTLVVRTLLVPALGITVDRRLWWPDRLARVTPTQAAGVSPVAEPEPAATVR